MSLLGATTDYVKWTPREDRVLRTAYLAGGIAAALPLLPGRTAPALYHRIRRMGYAGSACIRRRRWTEQDDARLRDLWDSREKLAGIAKRLERTPLTTYWRAYKLGLSLGVPEGYEYLTAAAKRSGYETGQLRRILRWAGASISTVRTRPNSRLRHFHFVDWLDVDDAIEKWTKTEPIQTAARRAGTTAEILRFRLRKMGVKPPPRKKHWRVTEAEVAKALAVKVPKPGTYRRAA